MANRNLSKYGYIVIVASRQEVENGDLTALKALQGLLTRENCLRFRQSIGFGISGYDDDPRELFEFPEVRSWIRKLDEQWPYWFFFLRAGEPSALPLIAFSLCPFETVPGGKRLAPQAIHRFITDRLAPMYYICDWLGDTDDVKKRMTEQILAVFDQ